MRQPGRSASRATTAGSVRRARSHRDAVTPVQQPARQRPADRPGPEHGYAHVRDYVSARELLPESTSSILVRAQVPVARDLPIAGR